MLTARDKKTLDFLEQHKVARTSTLSALYPSRNVCYKRLQRLTADGMVKRCRDISSPEYVYYLDRPKQLKHSLLVSDFYSALAKQAKITCFMVEPTFDNIRPDAAVSFIDRGIERTAFLEVELSNKGFDAQKYKQFNWRKYFDEQPELFVVSDRKIPPTGYGMKQIKTDLKFEI